MYGHMLHHIAHPNRRGYLHPGFSNGLLPSAPCPRRRTDGMARQGAQEARRRHPAAHGPFSTPGPGSRVPGLLPGIAGPFCGVGSVSAVSVVLRSRMSSSIRCRSAVGCWVVMVTTCRLDCRNPAILAGGEGPSTA